MKKLYACTDFKALPNTPQLVCQTWVELPQSKFDLAISREQAYDILAPILSILFALIAFKLAKKAIQSI